MIGKQVRAYVIPLVFYRFVVIVYIVGISLSPELELFRCKWREIGEEEFGRRGILEKLRRWIRDKQEIIEKNAISANIISFPITRTMKQTFFNSWRSGLSENPDKVFFSFL